MANCIIVGAGGGSDEQLGIYPVGEDSRPVGDVIVPEGITSLYQYIFFENSAITSVKLPESLTEMSSYSFSQCINLQKVELPSSLKTLPTRVFSECSSLTDITLPNSLTTLETYAFFDCKALTSIIIPESVKALGDSVFRESGLQEITIKTTEEFEFSEYSFYNCAKLKQIIIEDDLTKITVLRNAFYNCTSLTDEVANPIMSKIVSLGTYAFFGCTGLKNITPKYCNDYMFSGCSELVSVVINSALSDGTSGEYVFQNCEKLTNIVFSDAAVSQLKTIQQYYLKGCTSLESFIVPTNVTTISKYAFSGCTGLKYLYLPSTITSLTSNAINSCTALENIELGQDWNLTIDFSFATNLTVDSIVAMFNSLKDLTGETAKTLTLGDTNLTKITEEQKTIALNKNWILA